MASIKGALKKVYKALSGGKNTNAKSISGIIDDISTVASGGGGGLNLFEIPLSEPAYDSQAGRITAQSTVTVNQLKTAMNNGYYPYAHLNCDITYEQEGETVHKALNNMSISAIIVESEYGNAVIIGGEEGGLYAEFESYTEPLTFILGV